MISLNNSSCQNLSRNARDNMPRDCLINFAIRSCWHPRSCDSGKFTNQNIKEILRAGVETNIDAKSMGTNGLT